MSETFPTGAELENLPKALWLLDGGQILLCRGTPEEILRGIGARKGLGEAQGGLGPLCKALGASLARERGVLVEFLPGVPERKAAALFLHGLLVTRLIRAMGRA